MRVVFLESVPRVANAGEVKEVKDGYGRNYLLPRRLAAPATPSILKQLEEERRIQERCQARMEGVAEGLAQKLSGLTVTIVPKSGAGGRLYGAVTNAHIADELARLTGSPIDHRHVLLPTPIRRLGVYPVEVRLSSDHVATITVQVGEGQAAAPRTPEAPAAPTPDAEATDSPEQTTT